MASFSWIVQRNEYLYDKFGNLTSREDVKRGVTETFTYDNLNRLTSSSVNNVLQESVSYSANGNISSKTDVGGVTGTYSYSATKIHAVTSAYGVTMSYDANGNLLTRTDGVDKWSLCWTCFDKPRWMAKESVSGSTTYVRGNAFIYGPDHERVMNLEYDSVTKPSATPTDPKTWTPLHFSSKKVYISSGTLELEYANTVTATTNGTPNWSLKKARVYIPSPSGNVGTAELRPDATAATDHKRLVYHYDHLGSIQAITDYGESRQTWETLNSTDASGKQSIYSYDAWGQRRDAKDWKSYPWGQSQTLPLCTWGWDNPTTATVDEDDLIPRGFTGHEMLDDLGLVHMNGRIYDARLSRFLSADQIVQAPYNAQSYNRYSYCMNNPTGYVDPSGYSSEDDERRKKYTEYYGFYGYLFDDIDQGNAPGCYNVYNSVSSRAVALAGFWVGSNSVISKSNLDKIANHLLDSYLPGYTYGDGSVKDDEVISDQDIIDALNYLKQRLPAWYYDKIIKQMKVSSFHRVHDGTTNVDYYANGASYADSHTGLIRINRNRTDAFSQFAGTKEQFVALLIYHESMHYYYFLTGCTIQPNATLAAEEASIRFWVQDFAAANKMPESAPNALQGYAAIYKSLNKSVYTEVPFSVRLGNQQVKPNGLRVDANATSFLDLAFYATP